MEIDSIQILLSKIRKEKNQKVSRKSENSKRLAFKTF